MTGRIRLARTTTVAACQAVLAIEPLVVTLDTDLVEIVRRAALQPATRLVAVVDGLGRLAGVIPVVKVAESLIARVAPEALLVDVEDNASAVVFSHSLEDRTAADVMLPPASTTGSASIGSAFREMHRRLLGGLYVVDAEGRPTGYLDLLELAVVYGRALEAAAAEDSARDGAGSTSGEERSSTGTSSPAEPNA